MGSHTHQYLKYGHPVRVKIPDVPSITDRATGMWRPTYGELSKHSCYFLEWGTLLPRILSSLLGVRAHRAAGQCEGVSLPPCVSQTSLLLSQGALQSPLPGYYLTLYDQIIGSFLLSFTPCPMWMASLSFV